MSSRKRIKERWRPVPGFDGRYEISSIGRVRTICDETKAHTDRADRIMKLQKNNRGYLRVRLIKADGTRPWRRVHRMVCEAFVGPSPGKDFTVDHEDFDKENNSFSNLSWMSRQENWQRWRDREIETGESEAPF